MTVAHRVALALSLVGCSADEPLPPPSAHPAPAPSAVSPAVDAPIAPRGPEPVATPPVVEDPELVAQRAAYEAVGPKTIVDMALTRKTTREGNVTLVDLVPTIGVWYLATLDRDGVSDTFHLEDPYGTGQTLSLNGAAQLLLTQSDGTAVTCDLFAGAPNALDTARASKRVYAPVCDGLLYVRNPALGAKTPLEWSTDFLRDHVWGGEQLTSTVKATLYQDAERRDATIDGEADPDAVRPDGAALETGDSAGADSAAMAVGPEPQLVAVRYRTGLVETPDLGLPLDGQPQGVTIDGLPVGKAQVGSWYAITNVPGMWASASAVQFVDPDVIARSGTRARAMNGEEGALVYTVALDLDEFDLGYEVGTEHPRVGYSERLPFELRDPTLTGPDGFDNVDPLVRTGELDPSYQPMFTAAFVGGFKRMHGAFREGDLAGKHYGFVEYGLELSKMQPGYATMYVWDDGRIELGTWSDANAQNLPHLLHARQNGVPLVVPDPETGLGIAHELVRDRSGGNWASSVDGEFRSVRSGACIQDTPRGRYLLYSWFSSATPSGMAYVMSSYGCSYAMLLDMNALEHTYFAVDVPDGKGNYDVAHLITGMEVLDRQKGSRAYQRFIGFADNRDFFYVLRK